MDDGIHVPDSLHHGEVREHRTTTLLPVMEPNGNANMKRTIIALLAIVGGAISIPLMLSTWMGLASQVDSHSASIIKTDRKLERVETLLEVQKDAMREQKTVLEKQDAKIDRVLDAVNAIRRDGR